MNCLRDFLVIAAAASMPSVAHSQQAVGDWRPVGQACNEIRFERPVSLTADSRNLFIAEAAGRRGIVAIDRDGQVHVVYKAEGGKKPAGEPRIVSAGAGKLLFTPGPSGGLFKIDLSAGARGVSSMERVKTSGIARIDAVAVDSEGRLYVADGRVVKKIGLDGVAIVLAGGNSRERFKDGRGAKAAFHSPRSLAVDRNGEVFVADGGLRKEEGKSYYYGAIRRIDAHRNVTTLVGEFNQMSAVDEDGGAPYAQITGTFDIAFSKDQLALVERSVASVRVFEPGNQISTIVSSEDKDIQPGELGGIAVIDNSIYFSSIDAGSIYRSSPEGRVDHFCNR